MATTLKSRPDITVTPLSPAIGAEIGGVDLRREIAPEIAQQIREAWYQHAVLLFRDQDISEDDQFRFACLFGEVAERVHPPVEKRDWRPDRFNKMQLVTDRLDEQGRRLGSLGHGEMWFHTDKCYVERPHRASLSLRHGNTLGRSTPWKYPRSAATPDSPISTPLTTGCPRH